VSLDGINSKAKQYRFYRLYSAKIDLPTDGLCTGQINFNATPSPNDFVELFFPHQLVIVVRKQNHLGPLLKGQCHEIFDPRFFSSNNTPFLNSASKSPRYDRCSNAKIVHAVSMTPHARKFFVRQPL
jgi:hypothetical protein